MATKGQAGEAERAGAVAAAVVVAAMMMLIRLAFATAFEVESAGVLGSEYMHSDEAVEAETGNERATQAETNAVKKGGAATRPETTGQKEAIGRRRHVRDERTTRAKQARTRTGAPQRNRSAPKTVARLAATDKGQPQQQQHLRQRGTTKDDCAKRGMGVEKLTG